MTLRILCSVLAAVALASARADEADKEVKARKVALDLAGAFSNDGFKIRDGHWSGELNQGGHAVVAVNLYAGTKLGSVERTSKLSLLERGDVTLAKGAGGFVSAASTLGGARMMSSVATKPCSPVDATCTLEKPNELRIRLTTVSFVSSWSGPLPCCGP